LDYFPELGGTVSFDSAAAAARRAAYFSFCTSFRALEQLLY
jgi:hypothetical protein